MQILEIGEDADEEEGANRDLDAGRKGKCAVIKTSTRQVRSTKDTFGSLGGHPRVISAFFA